MHEVFSEPSSEDVIHEVVAFALKATPDVIVTQEFELDWGGTGSSPHLRTCDDRTAVRKHVAIVVGTLALIVGIAASGCTEDSDAEANSPVDISQLRADLEERFGTPGNEASWYRRIIAINWADGHVEVTTDFTQEEYSASEPAAGGPIPTCAETYKLASEQLAEPEATALVVSVIGPGGVALGSCG